MSSGKNAKRSWLEGFATGVAVCGLAMYAKRHLTDRGPQFVHEDGTVIPIE